MRFLAGVLACLAGFTAGTDNLRSNRKALTDASVKAGMDVNILVASQNMANKNAPTGAAVAEAFDAANIKCADNSMVVVAIQERESYGTKTPMTHNVAHACAGAGITSWKSDLHSNMKGLNFNYRQELAVFWDADKVQARSIASGNRCLETGIKWAMCTKGFIYNLFAINGNRVLFVSAHLPMSGSNDDGKYRVGHSKRLRAMRIMTRTLREEGLLDDATTVIFTGDLNMRVDTAVGEQLNWLLGKKSASGETAGAADRIQPGWVEPKLPSYYTCRFESLKKIKENKHCFDEDCKVRITGVGEEDYKECRSGKSAKYVNPKGAVTMVTAYGAEDIARTLVCGTPAKWRPFSFCDRVMARPGEGAKVDFQDYVSLPVHLNSDHNLIVSDLTLSLPLDDPKGNAAVTVTKPSAAALAAALTAEGEAVAAEVAADAAQVPAPEVDAAGAEDAAAAAAAEKEEAELAGKKAAEDADDENSSESKGPTASTVSVTVKEAIAVINKLLGADKKIHDILDNKDGMTVKALLESRAADSAVAAAGPKKGGPAKL